MSTVRAPTQLEAVHMRLVYFQPEHASAAETEAPTREPEPVTPADLTRVFRQLELLIDYAQMLTSGPAERRRTPSAAAPAGVRIATYPHLRDSLESKEPDDPQKGREPSGEQGHDPGLPVVPSEYFARIVSEELGINPEDIKLRGLPTGLDLIKKAIAQAGTGRSTPGDRGDVSVIALRMGSPLDILVEIPPATWPLLGFGLLALTERLATMPVRIARKRKQELLKSAMLDRQASIVNEGRADALAELLLREGPDRPSRAPDEVTFLDPGDPDDELIASSPGPTESR